MGKLFLNYGEVSRRIGIFALVISKKKVVNNQRT